MPFFSEHNRIVEQIESMNQRGGRSLSIVELVGAKTVSLQLASYLITLVLQGASIGSGAQIGGTGKTTLLAALLAFIPPDSRLVTVTSGLLREKNPTCAGNSKTVFLCHEISPGSYYSYLWDRDLLHYFGLADGSKNFLAFTIHADSPEEMYPQIINRNTGLKHQDFMKLDLMIFIKGVVTPSGYKRRVTAVYEKDVSYIGHVKTFSLVKDKDEIRRISPAFQESGYRKILREKIMDFLSFCLKENVFRIEDVRRHFFQTYSKNLPSFE
jgi:hypothetical protein